MNEDHWKYFGLALIVAIVVYSFLEGEPKRQSEYKVPKETVAKTPSVTECEKVRGILSRLVESGRGGMKNPAPGKFYMLPQNWIQANGEERSAVFKGLATQSACSTGTDPLYANVEIRSSIDNRLLASGTVWNIKDH